MRKFDSLEGLSLNSEASKERVTKKSSQEDWVRRLLIAFACFWLLVGIVFPLMDVVNRATHIELIVKIEEPTEQEKTEDSPMPMCMVRFTPMRAPSQPPTRLVTMPKNS